MISRKPNQSLPGKLHPFTLLTLGLFVAVLAMSLPFAGRVPSVLKTSLRLALPFWFFLILIHGFLNGDPGRAFDLGSRITSIILTFGVVIALVDPARLVDAMVKRGFPFSVSYLFASALNAVPAMKARAVLVLEAQRCRGLRMDVNIFRRVRNLVPILVPLIVGALAEVDERSFALETRGASSGLKRTPIFPPPDRPVERLLRWSLVLAGFIAIVVRIVSWA